MFTVSDIGSDTTLEGESGKMARVKKIHPSHPRREREGDLCTRCGLKGNERTEPCATHIFDVVVVLRRRRRRRKANK
jgi:hypothetical protein